LLCLEDKRQAARDFGRNYQPAVRFGERKAKLLQSTSLPGEIGRTK
jgi:hypothetical protein